MKANEVPEKIYVNYRGFGVFDEPDIIKMQASQIEYIRKDAVIEKAENILQKNSLRMFLFWLEGQFILTLMLPLVIS